MSHARKNSRRLRDLRIFGLHITGDYTVYRYNLDEIGGDQAKCLVAARHTQDDRFDLLWMPPHEQRVQHARLQARSKAAEAESLEKVRGIMAQRKAELGHRFLGFGPK